ncbi:MAG: PorV/PorQ family protein, partial [candidate division Zixibacteria bacterium]|nr:PorV/PorQ family protein [candidate division Zixibacteria bacterium]
FPFLTIGGSPRAVAMAEAMVADDQDPFVIEYNPADLVDISRFSASFAHNELFLDSRGEFVSAAVPVHRWAMGARLAYLGSPDIPRRVGPTADPLGYYDAVHALAQGALAVRVDDRLAVGLSGAYVVGHLDFETAQGFVLGIGTRYRLRRNITVGIAFANVGPPTQYVDREFQMPDLLRFGGAWSIGHLSARAEIVTPERDNVKWLFGSEYNIDPRLALRAGLKLGYDTQTFSAGAGLRTPDGRFEVDYAFAPYSDQLGSTHRFGLTVRP